MWVTSDSQQTLMPEPLVTFSCRDSVAVLSLNRPERHNALVPELLRAVLDTLATEECQRASVLVLRAEGQSFSTGGDLLGFQQHRENIGDYAFELVGLLYQAILALYTHPAPVACSVQGQVTGGSLGFLLASDWIVMKKEASITPWYAEVSFSPDGGWTAMLPAVIGRRQSLQWLVTNACYDADICHKLGLVHQVVENDCDAAVFAWAHKLKYFEQGSIRNSRQLINCKYNTIKSKLQKERELFVRQIQLPEAQKGIDRFLNGD